MANLILTKHIRGQTSRKKQNNLINKFVQMNDRKRTGSNSKRTNTAESYEGEVVESHNRSERIAPVKEEEVVS